MADNTVELNETFSIPGQLTLPSDILSELQSIIRLHSISTQELFFKWESYCIKMGSEETEMNFPTVRAFKKDIQETLERETRGRGHMRSVEKKATHATPRAAVGNVDVLGLLDGATPGTPIRTPINGVPKRKAAFDTPSVSKSSKSTGRSSPADGREAVQAKGDTPGQQSIAFADRPNAGQIIETLNNHLPPHEPPMAPPAESRVKITAETDIKKFYYKPLAMHLSEASEVLDDRIDEFVPLVQEFHGLEDSVFGSAASKSTDEVVAVGRIASDTPESKLNDKSLVLEMSRRTGAGLRVPLNVDNLSSYQFFPGQIVAVRGINASGQYFSASEVLDIPLLPPAASLPSTLDSINERIGVGSEVARPTDALNIIISAGPYTADNNLDFEPLHALCEKAGDTYADVLILIGPIFDAEHPLIASGDFDLPDDSGIEPDKATLIDVFRILVGEPLRRLAQSVPSIKIILVPSVRDAVNKHVAWPQEPSGKKELRLSIKQLSMVSNPITLSFNEIIVGISAQDVLYDLRREEVVAGKAKETNLLARLPLHLIQQRHFFPLFPPVNRKLLPKPGIEEGIATGMPLDISFLKLGEWVNVRPDILILPSALTPFAKAVEGVLVVNPGPLSKRKGPGTFAQLAIHPRKVTEDERALDGELVGHMIFERARVDITRI